MRGLVPLLAVAPRSAVAAAAAPHSSSVAGRSGSQSAADENPPGSTEHAQSQAKATGKPAEVTSRRTEKSTTLANPDGTLTTKLYAGPIRVQGANGWTPVDGTLVSDSSGVHPKAVADSLVLSGGGTGPLVTLAATEGSAAQQSLTIGAPAALPAPTLRGDTATYPNAVAGGHLVVQAAPGDSRSP